MPVSMATRRISMSLPLPMMILRLLNPQGIAGLAASNPNLSTLATDMSGQEQPKVRIGIDTGPVVAGVIGTKKFIYDLWGDTVNTASRMESHGIPGRIQVTAATYERLREQYLLEERYPLQVKGKGEMITYLLTGRKLENS